MKDYYLEFDDRALREWDALDGSVRKKFEKKLEKLIWTLTLQETNCIATYQGFIRSSF